MPCHARVPCCSCALLSPPPPRSLHVHTALRLARCVTTAELDFTQGTATKYLEQPTTAKTLVLSSALIAKYAKFFQ